MWPELCADERVGREEQRRGIRHGQRDTPLLQGLHRLQYDQQEHPRARRDVATRAHILRKVRPSRR